MRMKKKGWKIALAVLILAVYAAAVWAIRTVPALVAYRQTYGAGHIFMVWLVIFFVCLVTGFILHPKYNNPQSVRQKIGRTLVIIGFYSFGVMVLLAPVILALEIR